MYFDICTLDVIGNTHLGYEFDKETNDTVLVFHRLGNQCAKYTLDGECISSNGFSDELVDKMGYIAKINARRIEMYLKNGDI